MKKILICIAAALMLSSCSDIGNKLKEKAKQKLEEQIEKAAAEANKTDSEPEKTDEKKPEVKSANEWWQNNFSINYSYTPAGFGGSNLSASSMKSLVTVQRYNNVLRVTTQMGESLIDYVYKVEDGVIASYLFNAEKKKALRKIRENKTIDNIIKQQLSEHGVLPAKAPEKMDDAKMEGTEKFAERQCQKWVAGKNILGNISKATILVDKEFGFILKSDIYLKIGDKVQEGNILTVSDVSFKPEPKNVLIDFSNYEVTNN